MPPTDTPFRDRLARVESLVAAAEQLDPAARDTAREIASVLLELHAAGIGGMLDVLSRGGDAGRSFLDAFTRDGLISSVLLLHDLHPLDLPERVKRAVEDLGPTLEPLGGTAELTDIGADGEIHVRVTGKTGCGGTLAAVKAAVEGAVWDAAPDAAAVRVEAGEAPVLISLGVRTGR